MSNDKKPQSGEAKSIRVASSNVIKKEGSSDPKAVLSLYEDFLCPHCGQFEQQFGPTVNKLIDTGAVAADYYMVAILDRPAEPELLVARAANAAYCVADESTDAFRRFHAALYAQQPDETATAFPDNARLIEVARQAGAGGGVPDCINKGRYTEMVAGAGRGHRDSGHADDPHQRAGLQHPPRPTRWSPRSRRSSATSRGSTAPRHRHPHRHRLPRTRTGAVTVTAPSDVQPSEPDGGRVERGARCGRPARYGF